MGRVMQFYKKNLLVPGKLNNAELKYLKGFQTVMEPGPNYRGLLIQSCLTYCLNRLMIYTSKALIDIIIFAVRTDAQGAKCEVALIANRVIPCQHRWIIFRLFWNFSNRNLNWEEGCLACFLHLYHKPFLRKL